MAWWQASALFNGIISACYLAIAWNILKGLRDTSQMRTNNLALATAGIFFTCAVHHGSHSIHMLLPVFGVDVASGTVMRQAFGWHMSMWDLVGALVAVYYLSLRRSYGRLLTSPQMFEDLVREETERHLRLRAFTDGLTDLPNRAAFMDRVNALQAASDSPPLVLFLDLDRFKLVNDTLGHSIGDQLLVSVAARLRQNLRTGEELYRLGGDEFTVLRISATAEMATELSDRLLLALESPFLIEGHELYTGASIGSAQATNAEELSGLLGRADTAMYDAKAAGGSTSRAFEDSMSDKGGRLALSNDLTRGLARGEFFLEFQAIVDLSSGTVRGAEALIRWQHPQRGRLMPEAFIPFAEETGQIVSISRWVLRESCRSAAQWQGAASPPYVTVNVSAIEILREDFIPGVEQALADSGLAATQLWLEVTERRAGKDFAKLESRLHEVASLGVRVALDDFGTGWSSLTHLHRLPVNMIKIDRDFVSEPIASTGDRLVGAIILLGRSLNMLSVAEGIETQAQLQRLVDYGCDLGQGYLFSRPTDPQTFYAALREGPLPDIPRQRGLTVSRPIPWTT